MNIDNLSINTIKTLCLDIVENAGTGHLGMPLGAAPMVYALYKYHLNVDPKSPDWINRDRVVFSAGHGTPLIYSTLNLFGFNVEIDDLKKFRQLDSITPGHPEIDVTPGIDVSTGPLGTGIATAVGLAIAEKHLSSLYNKNNFNIFNHYTYVIVGDGCLMEGVANESISIAGTLGLEKLIVLYDSNNVCSDGFVSDSTNDNIKLKFESMNWNYLKVLDGNNIDEINRVIEKAKISNKPTIIEVKNIIGCGSKLQGTNKIHSDPVGKEEIKYIKENIGWNYEGEFYIPNEVIDQKNEYIKKSEQKRLEWIKLVEEYKKLYPEEYYAIFNYKQKINNIDFNKLNKFEKPVATRVASGKVLNFIYDELKCIMGGSADLGNSNKTNLVNSTFINSSDFKGNNINFGVREFAMGCIINGITLHSILIGYCATFLVFLDFMKASLRLAAIMKINPIYIYTHDTIIVGPDGKTHQPIEHLASLRSTPSIDVFRPVDANETKYVYQYAIKNNKPTVIVLARQEVDIVEGTSYDNLIKGGYVISDEKNYDLTVVSSGSEINLALKSRELLKKEGINIRVVNLVNWSLFDKQSCEYKNYVLDRSKPVVSIEASSSFGWHKYADVVISTDIYGESGNGKQLYEKRGFTVDNLIFNIKKTLNKI